MLVSDVINPSNAIHFFLRNKVARRTLHVFRFQHIANISQHPATAVYSLTVFIAHLENSLIVNRRGHKQKK